MDLNTILKKISATENDEILSIHKKTSEMRVQPITHIVLACTNDSPKTPKRKRVERTSCLNVYKATNIIE